MTGPTVGPLVYFLEAPPLTSIKIGFTSGELSKRIASIQTGCPFKLIPALTVHVEDMRAETLLHRLFDDERIDGEWFERSERITDAVGYLKNGNSITSLIEQVSPSLLSQPLPREPMGNRGRPIATVCNRGHDLDANAVDAGNGKRTCGICRRMTWLKAQRIRRAAIAADKEKLHPGT